MFDVVTTAFRLTRDDGHRRWLVVAALAVVVSLLEAACAGLVFALLGVALGLMTQPDAPIFVPGMGNLREWLPMLEPRRLVALLTVLTAGLFVVRAGVVILQAYVRARVTENVGARLASRLVAGYMRMPYALHLQRNSSDLIRNATGSVWSIIGRVLLPVATLCAEALLVVTLVAFLMFVQPITTLLAAAVMGFAVLVLMAIVQPLMRKLGHVVEETSRACLEIKQQGLLGAREIRLLGKEQYFIDRYRRSRRAEARAKYLASASQYLPGITIETTLVLFILSFLGITLFRAGDMSATVTSLGILAYVGLRMQPALQKITSAANDLRFATSAAARLDRERHLLGRFWDLDDQAASSGPSIPSPRGEVEIRGVTFSYAGAERPAIHDVSMTIKVGTSVGICGPTGGGKSTLISLLTGLLDPDQGTISVDGVDISLNRRAWQKYLGVVPQDVFLIDDTLRRNIALGVEDRDIDEDALREAVVLARLTEYVEELPLGLETIVGERGIRLSGGQRQRVAIARALYRRPAIIVMDEGTSALDGATEAAFMHGLEDLRATHTVIMVAHRLSTVRNCDRIYLVANGAIEDHGTYEELSARSTTFKAMSR